MYLTPVCVPSKDRHLFSLRRGQDNVSHRILDFSEFLRGFMWKHALTRCLWRKPSGSVHTHLALVIQGLKDTFSFPRIPPYPIRCALPAHDDDLGLFMFAHLNIYFSAQGEAEKKNVWGRDSTPAPRLLPTPLTFTRRPMTAPEESWDTQWSRWRASRLCEFGSASRSSLIAEFMPPFFMAAHCFDPVPLFNDP